MKFLVGTFALSLIGTSAFAKCEHHLVQITLKREQGFPMNEQRTTQWLVYGVNNPGKYLSMETSITGPGEDYLQTVSLCLKDGFYTLEYGVWAHNFVNGISDYASGAGFIGDSVKLSIEGNNAGFAQRLGNNTVILSTSYLSNFSNKKTTGQKVHFLVGKCPAHLLCSL